MNANHRFKWPAKRNEWWMFVLKLIYFPFFSFYHFFVASLVHFTLFFILPFSFNASDILTAVLSFFSTSAQFQFWMSLSITKNLWALHPHFLHGRRRYLASFDPISSWFVRSSHHLLRPIFYSYKHPIPKCSPNACCFFLSRKIHNFHFMSHVPIPMVFNSLCPLLY